VSELGFAGFQDLQDDSMDSIEIPWTKNGADTQRILYATWRRNLRKLRILLTRLEIKPFFI
jgi:hypothetical protein